jgi:CTP:molybdopterin cytidylyltransferase MocA
VIGVIAGLVLAAGSGSRLGMPKALLRLDGRTLVERAVGVLREGGCGAVTVVLGAQAQRVRAEADLSGAMVVVNPGWEAGMASSLKAGLSHMDADAAVVVLVDMPGITAAAVRRVIAQGGPGGPGALVTAAYRGHRGHPVLLGRDHWPGITALAQGDAGARRYLVEHNALEVPCDDVADGGDIDTRDQARRWGMVV